MPSSAPRGGEAESDHISPLLRDPCGSYPIHEARIPKALSCPQFLTHGSVLEAGGDLELRAAGATIQVLCRGEQSMVGRKSLDLSLRDPESGQWLIHAEHLLCARSCSRVRKGAVRGSRTDSALWSSAQAPLWEEPKPPELAGRSPVTAAMALAGCGSALWV